MEQVQLLARSAAAAEDRESVAADRAETAWDQWSLASRLAVLRRTRYAIAEHAEVLATAISPDLQRSRADTLVAEVLPLLAAIRYLERSAATVLQTRRLGVSGRPVWLGRVGSEVRRVPFGRVLVISVGNYPLLLPGVQVMQGLAAGNTVLWKPGRGGAAIARLVATMLHKAGLPADALTVTDESVESAQQAIEAGVDKIFFTGSAAAGREVLRTAAERVVPCVMELSGADAAIVLPSADVSAAARAICFGLRLNGSATCMAPRRVLLVDASEARRAEVSNALQAEMRAIGPIRVPAAQAELAAALLDEARDRGAVVYGGEFQRETGLFTPALILQGDSAMRVARTDVFAPLLTVIEVRGTAGVLAAQESCPLALTASIFGDEAEARTLAAKLKVGHISVNDVIVPTADPRVPFVGRKQSGFGATRGAEGLLEMTVPQVIAVRRGRSTRRYQPTGALHTGLFSGMASLLYGTGTVLRMRGLKQVVNAGRAITQAEVDKRSGEA